MAKKPKSRRAGRRLKKAPADSPKPRRIRDPVHDLIEFDVGELDQLAWRALDSAEFQRLRRIKQLGFSEFVFPGATHSRFAHSVGVFHTARRLSHLISARLGSSFDPSRAEIAQVAALVHDLGHGPFSHSFEDALKALGIKKRHEEWTAEIILGDTEVGKCLSRAWGGIQQTSPPDREIVPHVPGGLRRIRPRALRPAARSWP